jgi:hypothetical protein
MLVTMGCGNYGKVQQGRAIAYDKAAGLVTLVLDSAPQSDQPKYDVLPPVSVQVPHNAEELGAAPDPGKLLVLDTKAHNIMFFDTRSASIKSVAYVTVDEQGNVAKDDVRVTKVKLPAVDRQRNTVTIYSRRKKTLLTFSVPDEYLALPSDTWKSGDEIRYYYKDPSQALRMMNVSKTDLSKQGK